MPKVVCNASPMIFLAKIEKLSFLLEYEFIIPTQVMSEILKGHESKKKDAADLATFIKDHSVDIQEVEFIKGLPQYLGAGEKAAISLAVRQGIKQVFLDEAKARAVARFHGLKPVGTLGILWRVYQKGNLSIDEIKRLVFSLVRQGYRINEEILIEFLEKLR